MRILLTNDDGIHAPGLEALASEFAGVGELVRVAPQDEQSGVGHGISLARGLLVEDLSEEVGGRAFAVAGTPADCVKLAITELLKEKIDCVVSGINWGTNLGIDIHYSGTVAAAMEGVMLGIPSLAVSLERRGTANFSFAARVARAVFEMMRETGPGTDHVVNVNVPGCPEERIRGLKVAPHSTLGYDERFEARDDADGRKSYWLKGEVRLGTLPEESDVLLFRECYITVTPLQLDITHHEALRRMRGAGAEGLLSEKLFLGKGRT
ncbi:MAG: 5'/3'-nucleotidase SurE [Planctomycetota bacterium]